MLNTQSEPRPLAGGHGVAPTVRTSADLVTVDPHSGRVLPGYAERQALLLEISGLIVAGGSDEASLVRAVFERIREPLAVDVCFNYRIDGAGTGLELTAGFGIPDSMRAAAARLASNEALCGSVAASGAPLAADAGLIACDPRAAFVHQMGVRAYACHPLVTRDGQLLGTLSFASTRRASFEPAELQFFQTLSHFVSLGWERLLSERRLRDSEARLRTLTETVPAFVWMTDAEGRNVYTSPRFHRYTGCSAQELRGAGWLDVVHPLDRPRALESWQQAVQSGEPYEVVYRFRGADGTYRHFLGQGRPHRDESGRITAWYGTAVDIESQQRAEQASRASEERLHLAMEAGSLAAWEYELESGRNIWDERMARLLAVPAGVADRADSWLDTVHAQDRPRVQAEFRAAIELGARYETEFRVRRFDGAERWFASWGEPVRDAAGRIVRIVGLVQDITERKRAQERLQAADRQKDEFLAMLAHELRNPLTPIRNAVQLLGRIGTDPRERSAIGMIDRQSLQLTRLVDDLLDVSRIAQGRIELRHEPLAVAELVEQALETVSPLVREKKQQLRVRRPQEPLWVRGDRTRLVQSLSNVLHNATKYTDSGGSIELEVEGTREEVVIEVRDDGSGIAPELLPHVFDLFVQSERTLDRAQGGLGIGLSLVKRLAQMHGGSVQAASDGIGSGSTFTLRLPRMTPPQASLAAEPSQVGAQGRRVLVVDDNADAADSLVMLLQLEGYATQAAYGAAAALETIGRDPPEVVLLDIGLPEMDGYEVARQVRARHGAGLRLIALTGYGQADDRERALAAGFDAHLVKPADPRQLRRMLAPSPERPAS